MFTKPLTPRQRGLTIIELVIFIMIISIGVVGILQVLALNNRSSADPQLIKQAVAVAEGIVEEVQLAKFTYCDPDSPNAETATSAAGCVSLQEAVGPEMTAPSSDARPFDNINDYVAAFGAETELTTFADGTPIQSGPASLRRYRVFLRIDNNQALGGIAGAASADTNVLKITVRVDYGNGNLVLEGFRTRYNPN
ncbi:MAG TPA: prepilin-type N-terminal cleavage/methylation domain-containing protein [Burkholderiaceae bacterium]